MRMIDADALMQTLGITDMDCEKCEWGDYNHCIRGGDFEDACSAIENAPTIEPERKKGRWIPCSERLPDDWGEQIVNRLRNDPEAEWVEIIRCKDCIYYDPPHVENNGARYEYDEMPADAFDELGTGLVNAEYGINIGGRCCVDYYCKSYSDDKRVYVREDNYCGRAERRTDEPDK